MLLLYPRLLSVRTKGQLRRLLRRLQGMPVRVLRVVPQGRVVGRASWSVDGRVLLFDGRVCQPGVAGQGSLVFRQPVRGMPVRVLRRADRAGRLCDGRVLRGRGRPLRLQLQLLLRRHGRGNLRRRLLRSPAPRIPRVVLAVRPVRMMRGNEKCGELSLKLWNGPCSHDLSWWLASEECLSCDIVVACVPAQ